MATKWGWSGEAAEERVSPERSGGGGEAAGRSRDKRAWRIAPRSRVSVKGKAATSGECPAPKRTAPERAERRSRVAWRGDESKEKAGLRSDRRRSPGKRFPFRSQRRLFKRNFTHQNNRCCVLRVVGGGLRVGKGVPIKTTSELRKGVAFDACR